MSDGRTNTSMETEEDDLPDGPASQPTRPWLSSPIEESFRSEGTEQDDDKVTKAGQSSTGQADITWARRSSRSDSIIQRTWRRTIVRDNERDPCQGEGRSRTGNCRSPESSEHSEGSQRTSLGRVVTRRKRPEVCTCDCRNAHSTGSGSRSS